MHSFIPQLVEYKHFTRYYMVINSYGNLPFISSDTVSSCNQNFKILSMVLSNNSHFVSRHKGKLMSKTLHSKQDIFPVFVYLLFNTIVLLMTKHSLRK